MMEELLRVGVVANTHGLNGDVKIYPTTDDIGRFTYLKSALLQTRRGTLELTVERARLVKNMAVLKFAGYDSIDDVISWKGCDLMVTRDNAVPLEEGEYFIADLIGCRVLEEGGRPLGMLKDVLQTGANDVVIVDVGGGKELLIPWIDECVLSVDTGAKTMVVKLLDGLEEL
jgi:16S rRNA processing protein RimM